MTVQETTHRGVRWQRDDGGRLRFYDADGARWVTWGPKVDAPPLPPAWVPRNAPGGLERPPLRSRWRLIPILFIVVVVVIAVVQALRPSGHQAHSEAKATAALLGKCLAQDGTSGGHPKYRATPVPCDSPEATVRVAQVIPSTPGSPFCPAGTIGVELPYPGVRYLHVLCVEAVRATG
jgi:hypothetical protein